MRDAADVVLVSWVSVGHKAAPLLTALQHRDSHIRTRVRCLYLCWREARLPDGQDERDALEQTVSELRKLPDRLCPRIQELPWKTDKPPTDHDAIRRFAEVALQHVRQEHPQAVIAIHLSPGTPAMHAVWLVLGSTGFVSEPVELIQTADERGRKAGQPAVQRLSFALDTWLRRYRGMRPRQPAADDNGQIWEPSGVQSVALREALEQLRTWAPLRVPVLLVGERGTGKSTLANWLRANSPFQKRGVSDWPSVVCGQFRVNPQLARSELFGHAHGAFTGATKDKPGLLEQADGDTLFLDEIADIDRDTQRLLMAALEGRGFQRLGDSKLRNSRFRLVCATNRPLEELRSRCLDEDFYDRIGVFVLHVPPLRRCREDLPQAWHQVLRAALSSAELAPDGWEAFAAHPAVLGALATHALPGNFRDLQRAAFHLLAALNAGRAEAHVVESAIQALGSAETTLPAVPDASVLQAFLPVSDVRAHWSAFERSWLDAALSAAHGNKSKAAKSLGLPRKTFERQLNSPLTKLVK